MKKSLLFSLLILAFYHPTNAKKDLTKIAGEITQEGKTLYKIDMASWYGTDIFLARFKDKKDQIGGYFSYIEDGMAKCVFFSNQNHHKVLATFTFDSTYNTETAIVSDEERLFTTSEFELYEMRRLALEQMQSDTMFKTYKGSRLNLIPVIFKNERKVYIISAPYESNLVVIGNDYLVSYNEKLEITSKRKLHKSYIPIRNEKNEEDLVSMHSHLQGMDEFITPTDICTIMQYQKTEKWKQHYVVTKDYISIWDCKTNNLLILTMKAWKKMSKD